jgi:type I restriction enzyme R subunit
MPFQDVELEKLYSFGRFLLPKLPRTDHANQITLDNEVALEYYRLQKLGEGDLVLEIQGEHALTPITEAGINRDKEERAKLSDIITQLNSKFGTDFNEADKLFFDQIEEELFLDEDLRKRALNNPRENFKYAFEDVFINKLIERMDSNQEIFEKIMENSDFKNDVKEWLTKKIYDRFHSSNQ